jgi:hypothetical protein
MSAPHEPCLTLREAAELCRQELFPSGKITERSLRTEMARGSLHTFKIAGKLFTTRSDLVAMIEGARQCQDRAKDPISTSSDESGSVASPSGSSGTAHATRALAAARQTLQALKGRSKRTSPANTLRQRPATTSKQSPSLQ